MTTVQALFFFFFNDTATTEIYTLSLHDALPISLGPTARAGRFAGFTTCGADWPTVHSDGPATRAAGETPQGRVAGSRVYHGDVEAAADWGVDPAGVWGAPGGKFRVADPAADGLERAGPDEPGPATESCGSEA